VADELENPTEDEECGGDGPEPVGEGRGYQHREREHDQRDANGVTEAIDRMLVAGGVLRDPIVPGAVAEHGGPPEEDRTGARGRQGGRGFSGVPTGRFCFGHGLRR